MYKKNGRIYTEVIISNRNSGKTIISKTNYFNLNPEPFPSINMFFSNLNLPRRRVCKYIKSIDAIDNRDKIHSQFQSMKRLLS